MKIVGIILVLIGILSMYVQNSFYGYIDAEGVLHDSVFLPLGAFALLAGVTSLLMWGAKALWNKF